MTNTTKPAKAKKERNLSTKVFGYGSILILTAGFIRMVMLEADNLRNNDRLFQGMFVLLAVILVAYMLQAIAKMVSAE